MNYSVDKEIGHLLEGLLRLGTKNADETYSVLYGTVFKDDKLQNTLESLFGTLKAAKKRGIIDFKGELLMQGVHDKVEIKVLKPEWKP